MAVNQKVTNIYNLLSKNGDTNAKSVEEFAQRMSGNAYRQQIYGFLKKQGVGGIGNGYGEFEKLTGYEQKPKTAPQKKASAPKAESTKQATNVGAQNFGGAWQNGGQEQSVPAEQARTGQDYVYDYSRPITQKTVAQVAEENRQKDSRFSEQAGREAVKQIKGEGEMQNPNVPKSIARTSGSVDTDIDAMISDAWNKAEAQAGEKFNESYERNVSPYVGGEANDFGVMQSAREANEVRDPDKVLKGLQQNMDSYIQSHIDDITAYANQKGISVEDYANQLKDRMIAKFEGGEMAKYMPKSDLEYVASGIYNWIPSMLLNPESKGQQRRRQQAQQTYGDAQASGLAEFGKTAVEFADPAFGGAFGVGGKIGKGAVNIAGKYGEKAVSKIVGKEALTKATQYATRFGTEAEAKMAQLVGANSKVAERVGRIATSIPASVGENIGGMQAYNTLNSAVNQYATGSQTDEQGNVLSVGEAAWQSLTDLNGIKEGAIFGLTMPWIHGLGPKGYKAGSSMLTKAKNLGERAVYNAGGILATAGVMDLSHEGFNPTLNGFMHEVAVAGAMKINPSTLKGLYRSVANADPSRYFEFTPEEADEIMTATGTNKMSDALRSLFPADLESKGNATEEQVNEAQTRYLNVMNSLSWDAQQKLAAGLTNSYPIQRPRTARFSEEGNILTELDWHGNVLSRKNFSSEDEKKAYIAQRQMEQRNLDYLNTYFTAIKEYQEDAEAEIKRAAEAEGIDVQDVVNAIYKAPLKRTDAEISIVAILDAHLKALAYPKGRVNIAHAEVEGENVAESANILSDTPNVEPVQKLNVEVDTAVQGLQEALKDAQWADDYAELIGNGATDEEAYSQLSEMYNKSELAPLADAIDAKHSQDSFMATVQNQIESKVSELSNKATSGKKVVNGQPVDDVVIMQDADGNEYILLSGDISFENGVGKSEQPIAYLAKGEDGEWTEHSGNASQFTGAGIQPKGDFEDGKREELGVKATNVIDPEGRLNPENQPLGNAEGAGAEESAPAEQMRTEPESVGTQEGVEENGESPTLSESEGVGTQEAESETSPVEEAPKTTEGGIPLDEEGNALVTADGVKPVQAVNHIYNENGLTREEADAYVDDMVKESKDAVSKLEKKQPKLKGSLKERAEAKRKYEEDLAKAKTEADRWQSIYDEAHKFDKPSGEAEGTGAKGAQRAEVRSEIEEGLMDTPEAIIAQNMPKITPEAFYKETGLNAKDRPAFWLAGKEKGGMSVDEAVVSLRELFEGNANISESFIRDTIIDIISHGGPRSYIKRLREQASEQVGEYERWEANARDEWAMEHFHMDYDSYQKYEEAQVDMLREQYQGVDMDEIAKMHAEMWQEYESKQNEINNGRKNEGTDRGNEVLSEEQTGKTGGTAEGTESAGETGARTEVQGANGQAQGEEPVKKPAEETAGTGAYKVGDTFVVATSYGNRDLVINDIRDGKVYYTLKGNGNLKDFSLFKKVADFEGYLRSNAKQVKAEGPKSAYKAGDHVMYRNAEVEVESVNSDGTLNLKGDVMHMGLGFNSVKADKVRKLGSNESQAFYKGEFEKKLAEMKPDAKTANDLLDEFDKRIDRWQNQHQDKNKVTELDAENLVRLLGAREAVAEYIDGGVYKPTAEEQEAQDIEAAKDWLDSRDINDPILSLTRKFGWTKEKALDIWKKAYPTGAKSEVAEQPRTEPKSPKSDGTEDIRKSVPLTEEQIRGFEGMSDDAKDAAIDFLNGEEEPGGMGEIQYTRIANAVGERKEAKPNAPAKQERTEPKGEKSKDEYKYHLVAGEAGFTLKRENVTGSYPVGDGRWKVKAKDGDELIQILENNGMKDILDAPADNFKTLRDKIEWEKNKLADKAQPKTAEVKTTREEQKAKDKADVDKADEELANLLKNFGKDMLDAGKNGLSVSLVGLNAKQIEVVGKLSEAIAKSAFARIKAGVHDIEAIVKDIKAKFGGLMKQGGLDDEDIEDLLGDKLRRYKMRDENGERRSIEDWAKEYGKKAEAKPAEETAGTGAEDANVPAKGEFKLSSEMSEDEKPKTKDGWLKAMYPVYEEMCKKLGLPAENMLHDVHERLYPRITKNYPLDKFAPTYDALVKKMRETVAEEATEKQINFIKRLCEGDEWTVLDGVKLTKHAASYVIDLLKAEESAHHPDEFTATMEELQKVAELNGRPIKETDKILKEYYAHQEEVKNATETARKFEEQKVNRDAISRDLRSMFEKVAISGDEPELKSIIDIRKLAKQYNLDGLSDTDLQEIVESVIVETARGIAMSKAYNDEQKFQVIKRLYETQPSLNQRDNDRINLQQYSTPAPMAFVADMFLKGNGKKIESGLEPSAGNGMLTLGLPREKMHVNDIDEMRLSNLQRQGFKEVTNQDGTLPFESKKYDVIVTNPPFGSIEAREHDGYTITGLEHEMAINALDSMKDDGRAAIIIGGNTEYKENGSIKGAKDKSFLNYLYSHYNVVDVINMDGKKLYSRQGTGYNVRMILIDGRKAADGSFAPVKSKARAEQVHDYDELYNRINDDILRNNNESVNLHNGESGEGNVTNNQQNANRPAEEGVRGVRNSGGSEQPAVLDNGQRVQGNSTTTTTTGGRTANGEAGKPMGGQPSERNGGRTATATAGGSTTGGNTGNRVPERGNDTQRLSGNTNGGSGAGQRGTESVSGNAEVKRGLGTEKVPYRKQSGNPFTLNSLMPAEQADQVKKTLEKLGDVDKFLVDELGYSSKDDLHHALAAEQVDSVAMAISKMNSGRAFIIGDQTGIGKGRQAAALIRYGVKKGGCPVFVTVKKGLFSDMYRDLCDIGSPDLRPFIWAADDDKHSCDVTDADGNLVYKRPSDEEQKRVVDYINKNGKLPPEYDYVVTTYDSFKSGNMDYEDGKKTARKFGKGKNPNSPVYLNGQAKRDALEVLAGNSYIIMDESHNAGGEGSNVSNYLQYITTRAKGTTFLSATFAKRPGNMPIYALKTAISQAGVKVSELIDAVKRGGATFQEVMSKALTEAGEMIRRERDMAGVTIDWRGIEDEAVIEKQRQQYDEVIGLFNDIINFQKTFVDPIVDQLNDDAAESQGEVEHTPGTRDMGINNTPFASRTYNMVQQMLLSLKAEEAAKRAIEHMKLGRKAVITVANTNEKASKEAGGTDEDMVMPDLSVNLKKGLEGTLRITSKNANGDRANSSIGFGKLSPDGQKRYMEIMDKIDATSSGLSLSPIDVIKNELKKAGYKVGELTGREYEFVYNPDGTVKRVKRTDTDKKKVASQFNNGELDALILNRSAGTGISLHASSKFKDQRPRMMIVAQAQGDVNDEVQIRGRIDRTGQVHRGMYEYVVSQIPSEQRLLMMLKSKLRSLDANTTSSQKSKFNEMEVQDVMNKYGDQILIQYLAEHPDTYAKLADPLKWGDDVYDTPVETLISNAQKAEGDGATASKILGRMALLSVREQEVMLDEIGELYSAEINRLNEMGENDLEITEMPLKAKTLSKTVWEQGVKPGSGNPFADNTYVEKVDMDVLKKPMKGSEVKGAQATLTGGHSWDEYKAEKMSEFDAWEQEKVSALEAEYKARAEKQATDAKEKYQKGALKAKDKNGMTEEEIAKNADLQYKYKYDEVMQKFAAQKDAISKQKQVFVRALETFSTDGVYVIPENIYDLGELGFGEKHYGKLIDVKVTGNYSPNASTLTFATLDGRRKVIIPINGMVKQVKGEKKDIFQQIVTETAHVRNGVFGSNEKNRMQVLEMNGGENWDKMTSTASRKEGYIITGNLLKALVSTREQGVGGKLISYTTDSGEIKQGLLMSDNFEPKGLTSKTPISSKFENLVNHREDITSADGQVLVKHDYRDWYELRVPKSVKAGGKYFNDEKLLKLVYNQFSTRAGKMCASIEGKENLEKVLKRLDELGVTVADEVKDDDSRLSEELDDDSRLRILDEKELEDAKVIEWLDSQKQYGAKEGKHVYHSMQLLEIDGKKYLFPPMAAKQHGKLVQGIPVNEDGTIEPRWEQADENPDLAYMKQAGDKGKKVPKDAEITKGEDGKYYYDGKPLRMNDETGEPMWYFDLKKGSKGENGKNLGDTPGVAYDPYQHGSTSPLNDQFKSAWNRGHLVTVEVAVPESEITNPHRSEKASLTTGEHEWPGGVVAKELKPEDERKVILSRWDKPLRIVPDDEVAGLIKGVMDRNGIEKMPFNVVSPSLRDALIRKGVKIGHNEGLSSSNSMAADEAYEKWREETGYPYYRDAEGGGNDSKVAIKGHVAEVAKSLGELGKGIAVHDDISSVTNKKARKALEQGRKVAGWWDSKTNSVHLYMPNIHSKYEANKTIVHETVGHKGLRELLNTKENPNGFNQFMDGVWADKSNTELHDFVKKYAPTHRWDIYEAVDEWLAREAEKNISPEKLTMWGKVKDAFNKALVKIGLKDASLNINDVRMAIWLSRNRGNNPNDPLYKARLNAMREKLAHEDYRPATKDGEYVGERDSRAVTNGTRASEELDENLDTMGMGVRAHYDSVLQTSSFKRREAFLDNMEALRVLQKVIAKGKEVADNVNAYLAENHITSIAEAQWNKFRVQKFKPLEDAINQCVGLIGGRAKTVLDKVDMYIYKKHGLERNRYMYVKKVLEEYAKSKEGIEAEKNYRQMQEEGLSPDDMADMDKSVETADKKMSEYQNFEAKAYKDYKDGKIDYAEYLGELDYAIREYIDADYQPNTVDFSGISAFDAEAKRDGKDVEYDEQKIINDVMEMEGTLGKDNVDNLWSKINEATDFGVDYAYQSGQADSNSAKGIKSMYHWYVPLRGFAEDKMEDIYEGRYNGGNTNSNVGKILKRAWGRTSLADSPLATISAMANGAILQGERNKMLQKFYRLNLKNPNDAVKISETWEVPAGDTAGTGAEEWKIAMPELRDDMTAKEIADAVDAFNKEMQEKEAKGEARKVIGKPKYPAGFLNKMNAKEHAVRVYINGREKWMWVTGDPRAAQALRGEINHKTGKYNIGSKLMHKMAGLVTSYSPEFITSNFSRDTLFASANIKAKENWGYWSKFTKNQAKCAALMGLTGMGGDKIGESLFEKYYRGRQPSTAVEQMFFDFMDNGGRTGFIAMRDIEDHKDKLRTEIKAGAKPAKVWNTVTKIVGEIPKGIEEMNMRAELVNRFATYMTSREMGRSKMRSVADAKEVSVNFNRHGAGNAGSGLSGFTAGIMRNYYMFFNAGMQSMNLVDKNLYKEDTHGLSRLNPKNLNGGKAGWTIATMGAIPAAVGYAFAMMMANGDDEEYSNIPSWDRRNNLCIPIKGTGYVKIPLPIELRAFWGMGDIIASMDKPRLQTEESVPFALAGQISQALPLDVLEAGEKRFEGDTGWIPWLPTMVRPIAEEMKNVDWTGKPIQKDSKFFEDAPEWTLAYSSLPDFEVQICKYIHDKTREGVNTAQETDATGLDISPAKVDHLLKSYFGGAYSILFKGANTGVKLANGEVDMAHAPIVSRLWGGFTDKEADATTNAKYWSYKREYDNTHKEFSNKGNKTNPMAMSELRESGRGKRHDIFLPVEKRIKALQKLIDNTTDADAKARYKEELAKQKRDIVDAMDAIE